MTIRLQRADSHHPEFLSLVKLLDADLRIKDGDEHAFYAQYNKVDMIREVIVAFEDIKAVGCGAIKRFSPDAAEVKRMYVLPEYRGQGIAKAILSALESWACELGFSECILETGKKQPDAIALYLGSGYKITENYGQYAGVENSVCMSKPL